ncbi:hypothetical protein Vretifemale_15059, partial [Volvox reticuliferus]
ITFHALFGASTSNIRNCRQAYAVAKCGALWSSHQDTRLVRLHTSSPVLIGLSPRRAVRPMSHMPGAYDDHGRMVRVSYPGGRRASALQPAICIFILATCFYACAVAREVPQGAAVRADAAHQEMLDFLESAGVFTNISTLIRSKSAASVSPQQSDGGPCRVDPVRGCINRCWVDFQNGQNAKTWGWVLNIGYAHLDWEGWRMHSTANGVGVRNSNTRVHFDGGNAKNPYFFNTAKNPKTSIMVWLRGAPDAGKNSNLYLMESRGGSDDGIQKGYRIDEIDLVEMYGSKSSSERCVYSNPGSNRFIKTGPNAYSTRDPGREAYMYELYLERGRYLKMWAFHPSNRNNILGMQEYSGSDVVPDSNLRMYAGIWDCSSESWCPGKFSGDASMVIKGIWIHTCY